MKIKDIVEARMSAAVKLQRAFEREQSKSTASKERADQAKAEFEKTWKAKQEKEKQGVAEGVPQPGPSSGAPKQFGPDAKIQTRQMTVKDIISSIPGVPYYNNVVDDWDAKDYSWNTTEKVIEYATYLKDHPESLAKLPPIIVLNGKFEDGAHRVSAIWLLQQRMDPKNPLWKNAKLNVQFVKQGAAEAKDQKDVSEGIDELARVLELSGLNLTADEQFDIIEEMVESLALEHGVDAETIWEEFESVDDHELFEAAAWQKKSGKSKTGGLNAKGVASYRRENPGSKLQMAVTTKPSKLKPGSKAAKRRKSFCARMGGNKGPMKKPNGKPTRKALALRKWNC